MVELAVSTLTLSVSPPALGRGIGEHYTRVLTRSESGHAGQTGDRFCVLEIC